MWVVGGGGYLGQEVVKQLYEIGAKVVCLDINNRAETFVKSNNFNEKVIGETFDAGNLQYIDDVMDNLNTKYELKIN
ncbi:hypothetical protein ACFQ2C_08200 [Sphingobacterium daejeonense]|uniref:3-beta hydroxysteroid dehydrogenase/isomerase domain-containing protein n=1 Tax=Sphingobacterium daejeonense TaxID=371142 RepID=A0ABW3RK88_9SPHI